MAMNLLILAFDMENPKTIQMPINSIVVLMLTVNFVTPVSIGVVKDVSVLCAAIVFPSARNELT